MEKALYKFQLLLLLLTTAYLLYGDGQQCGLGFRQSIPKDNGLCFIHGVVFLFNDISLDSMTTISYIVL